LVAVNAGLLKTQAKNEDKSITERSYLLRFALVDKIAWRFRDERDHETHKDTGNELNSHSDPPLSVIVLHTVELPKADSIVDEEGQHEGEEDHQVVRRRHRATNRFGRVLGQELWGEH